MLLRSRGAGLKKAESLDLRRCLRDDLVVYGCRQHAPLALVSLMGNQRVVVRLFIFLPPYFFFLLRRMHQAEVALREEVMEKHRPLGDLMGCFIPPVLATYVQVETLVVGQEATFVILVDGCYKCMHFVCEAFMYSTVCLHCSHFN